MINNNSNLYGVSCVALRDLIVFPNMVLNFDAGRKKSIEAVRSAMAGDRGIFLVTQYETAVEDPKQNDVYTVGCYAKIRHILKISENEIRVLVGGVKRAKLNLLYSEGAHLKADITLFEDEPIKRSENYVEALFRKVKENFEKYAIVNGRIPPDIIMEVMSANSLSYLCDYIAMQIPASMDDKHVLLEEANVINRAKALTLLLKKEGQIIAFDKKIDAEVRTAMDDQHREYYMREQIKALNNELYGDDSGDEIEEYRSRILALNAPEEIKEKLNIEVNKLLKMPAGSHEATVVRNYLDICLELPWLNVTKVSKDISRSQKILDRDFYGMKKVKDRILEMLCVYNLKTDISGQIICLVGPPGVGKTSIGKTIAECMGRRFARLSLGGVSDEAEIRGHRKTYIGAMPGRIINAVKQAGSNNALILLDEIDKLGRDYKGDPAAALLEVLDGEQNSTFTDHYIELPYDLSKIVFIATANSVDTIPPALFDRLEIIELSSYTREEKFNIAKKFLIKRQLQKHGLTAKDCKITDDAIYAIIDGYTRESGVRLLERQIATLCRKAVKAIVKDNATKLVIKATDLHQLIGPQKYSADLIEKNDEVGLVNGLAWTSVGGELLPLEVCVMEGTGKIELTGCLGDVMKESARAAITFIRANANVLGVDSDFYKTKDIHIHAPENAVPKDGPSAGVTITTAIVSALTGKKVRRDIAMTGEVTIRGRVLKIGGLREKAMAAHRSGINTVFIPKENVADLSQLDDTVRTQLNFVPVQNVTEILNDAFVHENLTDEKSDAFSSKINFIPEKSVIRSTAQ